MDQVVPDVNADEPDPSRQVTVSCAIPDDIQNDLINVMDIEIPEEEESVNQLITLFVSTST